MAVVFVCDALQNKKRTPEEDKQLDFLLHGGSFVAFENLEAIREWIEENR